MLCIDQLMHLGLENQNSFCRKKVASSHDLKINSIKTLPPQPPRPLPILLPAGISSPLLVPLILLFHPLMALLQEPHQHIGPHIHCHEGGPVPVCRTTALCIFTFQFVHYITVWEWSSMCNIGREQNVQQFSSA